MFAYPRTHCPCRLCWGFGTDPERSSTSRYQAVPGSAPPRNLFFLHDNFSPEQWLAKPRLQYGGMTTITTLDYLGQPATYAIGFHGAGPLTTVFTTPDFCAVISPLNRSSWNGTASTDVTL